MDAAVLDKLEPPVVSAPHSFGRDPGLELGSDVGGGQFGEGAFEFRFLEIEGVVGDRWGGAFLVDQTREGEEDVGRLLERPVYDISEG